jgi:parallel beta-helix repeat protein
MRHLQLNQNRANQNAGCGVYMSAAIDCIFEDLYIQAVYNCALYFDHGSHRGMALNVHVYNALKGVVFDGAEYGLADGCYATNIGSTSSDDCFLLIDSANNGTIVNCRVLDSLGDGASIYTSSNCTISDCVMSYVAVFGDYGIDCHGAANSAVIDNRLNNCGGVTFNTGSNYVIFAGNILHDTRGTGIGCTDTTYCSFEDNIIENASWNYAWGVGIMLASGSLYNLVADNKIHHSGGSGPPPGPAISVQANCDDNILQDNDLRWNNNLANVIELLTPLVTVIGNRGYNPHGNVATPYPAAAGNISDKAAAQAFPTTHTDYTIVHSPKLITIYGGTVTQILIDGVVCGLTSGAFRLEPGQVLHVDWTGQPSSVVYAV